MDKDRKESRGRGTLLLVMKRDPKSCVSCLKGIYRIWPEAVESPDHHWPQVGREYFAHQCLIFGIDGHPLVELAYVLYEVRLIVVHSESRLKESPREFYPLFLAHKG